VEDIDKGQRWGLILAEQLESTHAGVICLTPENLTAPWLLFEAGALSKLHKDSKVCTYLIEMPYAAVPPQTSPRPPGSSSLLVTWCDG
jgi:hypothetical protein